MSEFKKFEMADVINENTITNLNANENVLIYILQNGFLDIKNGIFYNVLDNGEIYEIYKDNVLIFRCISYDTIISMMRSIIGKVRLSR